MKKCDLFFIRDLRTDDNNSVVVAIIYENGSYTLTQEFYNIGLFSKEIIETFLKQCSLSKDPIEFAVKSTGQPHTSIYIDNIS